MCGPSIGKCGPSIGKCGPSGGKCGPSGGKCGPSGGKCGPSIGKCGPSGGKCALPMSPVFGGGPMPTSPHGAMVQRDPWVSFPESPKIAKERFL